MFAVRTNYLLVVKYYLVEYNILEYNWNINFATVTIIFFFFILFENLIQLNNIVIDAIQ